MTTVNPNNNMSEYNLVRKGGHNLERTNTANGWNEWAKKVLADNELSADQIQKIFDRLNTIAIDLAVLKNELAHIAKTEGERAGRTWGAIVGLGTSIIVGVIMLFLNHLLSGK